MLALNGDRLASSDVDVPAPPVNLGTTFAVDMKAAAGGQAGNNDVAGWRYEVVNQ